MSTTPQMALPLTNAIPVNWDEYPPGFFAWLQINRHIYRKFKRRAFMYKRAGRSHYSARAIVQELRWQTKDRQKGDHTFKINNIHTPGMARLAMAEHEELKGFFRCRNSQGLDG